jgi:hypothetical protein
MKDKFLKYGAVPALGIVVATSAFAFAATSTTSTTENKSKMERQFGERGFGGKGGLHGEVKAMTAEDRAKMEAEHDAKFAEMLAARVKDGTITQNEANKVIEAEKIIKAQHESVRSIMEKIKPTKPKTNTTTTTNNS